MPFRTREGYSVKMQFRASAALPSLVRRAAEKTGRVSSTDYIQQVLAKAVARDLGVPLEEITDALPPVKSLRPAFLDDGTRHTGGSSAAPKVTNPT